MDLQFFTAVSKESLVAAILLPIVILQMKTGKEYNKQIVDAINSLSTHLERALVEHDKKMEEQFVKTSMSMGNTVLDKDQTVRVFLSQMWFTSYGKLTFIEDVIRKNHIEGRREEITKKIEAELMNRSQEYYEFFHGFSTPVGDLADWLDTHFTEENFACFVKEIVDVVYTSSYSTMETESATKLKVNDVATIMKNLQNNLGRKLRESLKNV